MMLRFGASALGALVHSSTFAQRLQFGADHRSSPVFDVE
jgi:hypothetical protein